MREAKPLPFVSEFGDLPLRILQLCCVHICFLSEKPDKREEPFTSQEAHRIKHASATGAQEQTNGKSESPAAKSLPPTTCRSPRQPP